MFANYRNYYRRYYHFDPIVSTIIAAAVFAYIPLLAVLVPIIKMHRLKKSGKLPAPGAKLAETQGEAIPLS